MDKAGYVLHWPPQRAANAQQQANPGNPMQTGARQACRCAYMKINRLPNCACAVIRNLMYAFLESNKLSNHAEHYQALCDVDR